MKKMLVESSKLEISQAELEEMLFLIMERFGYGENFVKRYKMITTFYQKRLPFIIIIAGTECMGKSTLVTQLGDRINISNIVQTSIVHKVMMGLSAIIVGNQQFREDDTDQGDLGISSKESLNS